MKTEKSRIPHLTPQKVAALKSSQRKIEQRIMDLIGKNNAISEALYDAGYPGKYVWDGVMGWKLIDPLNCAGWTPEAESGRKKGKAREFIRMVSEQFGTAPSAIYLHQNRDLVAVFERHPLLPFYVGEDMEPFRGTEGIYNGPVEDGE